MFKLRSLKIVTNRSPLAKEFYKVVAMYLAGALDLTSLEDWIVPRLPELLKDSLDVQNIVGEIELNLAEYSHEDITYKQMMKNIKKYFNKRSTK